MAVVYHLDKFVKTIASIMPDATRKLLTNEGGRVFLPDNTKLYYQFGRMFGVTYREEVNFYGLSRYSDTPIDNPTELVDLAHRVVAALETFGCQVTKLTSPIAVYSQALNRLSFPRVCDLPSNALDMIIQCATIMTQEWRQVYTLGHWDASQISDYDLNAGYPSIIMNLPDIHAAKFFSTDSMPSEYSWGVLLGRLRIDKPVSPFMYQGNDTADCCPRGSWNRLITTDQLWLLRRWGIGDFELANGWFFQLPKVFAYPFKQTMERLYQARDNPNELITKCAKAISVGIWGKLAERYNNGKLGDNYNSIYALMTTSRCMVKVADFIYRNKLENDVVSVMVDGTLATKKLPIVNRRVMGTWRMNEPSNALVLSTLYQWLSDKRPGNMTYPEIMALIKANPKLSCYGDVDFNLLDHNRKFERLPKNGGDLIANKYHSEPHEVKD